MTIVRVGATKKYSDGWEAAFGKGKKAKAAPAATEMAGAKKPAMAGAKKPAMAGAKKPVKASAKRKTSAKKKK